MKKRDIVSKLSSIMSEGTKNVTRKKILENEKKVLKKELSSIIKETYTLQYADSPTSNTPVVKIEERDLNSIYYLGLEFPEDEEIHIDDLEAGIEKVKSNIREKAESGLPLSDFSGEIETLSQLSVFVNQSKMDGNKIVMMTDNIATSHSDAWGDEHVGSGYGMFEESSKEYVDKITQKYGEGSEEWYSAGGAEGVERRKAEHDSPAPQKISKSGCQCDEHGMCRYCRDTSDPYDTPEGYF